MDDKYIKTNVEGLVKDRVSKAVLCVDDHKLAAYRKQKRFMTQTTDTTKRLEKVEEDINEIKQMFSKLLEKLDK